MQMAEKQPRQQMHREIHDPRALPFSLAHILFCLYCVIRPIERLPLRAEWKAVAVRHWSLLQSVSTAVDEVKPVSSLEFSQAIEPRQSTTGLCDQLNSYFQSDAPFSSTVLHKDSDPTGRFSHIRYREKRGTPSFFVGTSCKN